MRILLTNNTLDLRAGSELFVRDVALALLRRGHQPVAYSTRLGAVAEELRLATIPVIDDLGKLAVAPDVIHGQHHLDAMTAMLAFPATPAIYYCHGWLPWEEMGAHFPTIRRYVAVDDLCVERLQCIDGVDPSRIRVVRNFVDLRRFEPREGLPVKPRRALVFSNYAREDGYLAVVRRACAAIGLEVDAVGSGVGRSEPHPERILGNYDVVFGKARCALEALACGTAVITADASGLAGMVTSARYDDMRRLNFGVRTLREPVTFENVLRELALYDAADAERVSARVRAEADMEKSVDALVGIYEEAVADRCNATENEKLRAVSAYLRRVAIITKARYDAEHALSLTRGEVGTQRARAERAESLLASASAEVTDANARAVEASKLREQIGAMRNTKVWRLRQTYFRWKKAAWKRT